MYLEGSLISCTHLPCAYCWRSPGISRIFRVSHLVPRDSTLPYPPGICLSQPPFFDRPVPLACQHLGADRFNALLPTFTARLPVLLYYAFCCSPRAVCSAAYLIPTLASRLDYRRHCVPERCGCNLDGGLRAPGVCLLACRLLACLPICLRASLRLDPGVDYRERQSGKAPCAARGGSLDFGGMRHAPSVCNTQLLPPRAIGLLAWAAKEHHRATSVAERAHT